MAEPVLEPRLPEQESETPWVAIGVGLFIVVTILVALVLANRNPNQKPPVIPPAYADNLKISDLKLSTVENFVGSSVTYIEGKVTNAGPKVVSGITVEIVFRNSLGEMVQKETMPLQSLVERGPYMDVQSFAAAPLHPNEVRPFRLTFEHISADWNHGYPEVRVVGVKLQ